MRRVVLFPDLGLNRKAPPISVFIIAFAAALALAAVLVLNAIQQTSAQACHTEAVRLDQQESVDHFGRPG